MQLPGGKRLDTMFGGENSLNNLLERAKHEDIGGFIKISLRKKGHVSEGSLLIESGNIVGATMESSEKEGDEALPLLFTDALYEDCVLELRTYSYKSSSQSIQRILSKNPSLRTSGYVDTSGLFESAKVAKRTEESYDSKPQAPGSFSSYGSNVGGDLDGMRTDNRLALSGVRQKIIYLRSGAVEHRHSKTVVGHIQHQILTHNS